MGKSLVVRFALHPSPRREPADKCFVSEILDHCASIPAGNTDKVPSDLFNTKGGGEDFPFLPRAHIPEVWKKIDPLDIRTNQSVIWSGDVIRHRPPSVTTSTLGNIIEIIK